MDTTAKEITFDENGVCSFCHSAQQALKEIKEDRNKLSGIIDRIKLNGKGKKYDCLIGLSGGVDSSTVLHNAIRLGLRPLCFSLDNGWNTHKADKNIERLVRITKVPYEVIKIDLQKYGELQGAFFDGGIKNIEAVTDHILFAVTYDIANKNNIKWILSGGNEETESVMPSSWGEDARDLKWIKAIYKKMTGKRLKGLPTISLWKEQYYRLIKGVKFCRLLNYSSYDREKYIELLKSKYMYKPYGDKHCESKFTMWFQNYFLLEKYGIDKRKAHFSSLINSGQMTRDEALKLLENKPSYPNIGLDMLIRTPKKEYEDYKNSKLGRKIVVLLYKISKIWR